MVVASCHRSSVFVTEDAKAQESYGNQWLSMLFGVLCGCVYPGLRVVVQNIYV